jgi:hypothetical protein
LLDLVCDVCSALNLPSTSSLFANEMREKRRIAAEEKRREVVLKLAKSEQLKAERMSLVLNTAPQVQKKRKTFALQVLLRQALYFVCVMAAFVLTTPAAPDFYSAQMARYRSIVIDRFKETYDVRIWVVKVSLTMFANSRFCVLCLLLLH